MPKEKEKIKCLFEARVWKHGKQFILKIPRELVTGDTLDRNKEYVVSLKVKTHKEAEE